MTTTPTAPPHRQRGPRPPLTPQVLRKRLFLGLLLTAVSLALSAYSDRSIDNQPLAVVYLIAAGLHGIVTVHAAYKLSGWERPDHDQP